MLMRRSILKEFTKVRYDSSVSPAAQSQPSTVEELEHRSCGFAQGVGSEHVYNEEGFRYLLEIERRRSELSARPFLLLLIDMKTPAEPDVRINDLASQHLLSALALCVRETDFIGWYHEGRVAGAVLTQHADAADADIPGTVRQRIAKALTGGLPKELAGRLQLRVYRLPVKAKDRI